MMTDPKHPVLLIHGIGDTERVFDKMVRYLRDRGWTAVHTLNLAPNNGDIGLDVLALQIQDYVNRYLASAPAFDLIGFSMGGLVSRYYVQRLGGLERVRHFLTLSTPHNGTWMGYLRHNVGVSQMRPQSPFLNDLNSTVHDLQQVNFTSLWTPYDLIIVPANSSYLPVGSMVQVPVLAHPLMLTDPRSLETVAQVLAGEPLSQPTAA
jgi:triacylglycerol lipase